MNKIFLEDLPDDVKGFSRKNDDDSVTIILNSRYSHETNIDTYCHELSHNNDYGDCDVDNIEAVRHERR